MKMRGKPTPEPSYSPDVAGLLQWLRQPPSQWSALGWKNAPAWADAIGNRIAFLENERDKAIDERDEARREYCRGYTDFCPNAEHEDLSLEDAAIEVAKSFGWDCFDDCGHEGEVNP